MNNRPLHHIKFWLSLVACWGAALLALYTHPAFWALFGFLLIVIITGNLRRWK